MAIPDLFDVSGLSPEWRSVVDRAFARGAYPWETLREGLRAKTGRTAIPIDTADLSRFGAAAAQLDASPAPVLPVTVGQAHDHEHHDHPALEPSEVHPLEGHVHPEENGDRAHLIEYRRRALGLAWYSGRVTLEVTLRDDEPLATEVQWAELWHMVDFFGMTGEQRRAIFAAYHGGEVTDHGHGTPEDWFGDRINLNYWFQVGEAGMAGFGMAIAGLTPRLGGFGHVSTPEVAREIRRVLLGEEPPETSPPPAPDASPPTSGATAPPPAPDASPGPGPGETPAPYFAQDGSPVFHDVHRGRRADKRYPDRASALAAGLRPCGVCRP